MGGGYGAKLRDERHLAKLVQLARTPDEKGFGDRRIRLVTNFLIGIIHLYRPAGGTTPTPPSLLRATRDGPRFSTSMETTLHSFWKRNLNGWTSSKEARKIRDDDCLVAQLLRPIVIFKVCTLQVKLCNTIIDFDFEGQYFNIFGELEDWIQIKFLV